MVNLTGEAYEIAAEYNDIIKKLHALIGDALSKVEKVHKLSSDKSRVLSPDMAKTQGEDMKDLSELSSKSTDEYSKLNSDMLAIVDLITWIADEDELIHNWAHLGDPEYYEEIDFPDPVIV